METKIKKMIEIEERYKKEFEETITDRNSLQKTINESKNYFIFNSLLLALLIEFIPFRSSGSFFATENATFIFLLFGLIAGCKYSKN